MTFDEIIKLLKNAENDNINDLVNHVHPADVLEAVLDRAECL